MGAVDTHAHIFPNDYLDYLGEHGRPKKEIEIAQGMNADSSAEEMESRLEWMDRAGVDTQVIAVTPQVPSLPEAQHAQHAAKMVNDEYAQIIANYPGRFIAYGALPLPHVTESVAEVERIFDELNFAGVSVPTIIPREIFLDSDDLEPVWEALNAHNAVVNIHPTGSGVLSPMLNTASLEWVNGAPVEDGTATLRLLKADIPHRFPNITFHIAHLGGDLPFMAQRIYDNYEDWDAFAHNPIESLKKMYFDAANFHEPSLRLAVETLGAETILGGSDFPYFQKEKYVRAFSYIRDAKLDNGTIEMILSGNARRLFGRAQAN